MRSGLLLNNARGGAVVVAPPAVFTTVIAADVTTLADAGMVTVGVAGLADAGMAFPADLAGVIAADATILADAGMVTIGVADLADAGMAFAADLAGLATVGVTDLADVVCSPDSGGDIVMWGDRTSSGVWCRAGTPNRSDVDCQYVGCVCCVPVGVDCAAPAAGCSDSLVTCSYDNLCPVTDYMTCWENLEAMSNASYDSYGGVDGQPGYFDDDDPRDYWCAWNDVDEDEGYYAPFPPDVTAGFFRLELLSRLTRIRLWLFRSCVHTFQGCRTFMVTLTSMAGRLIVNRVRLLVMIQEIAELGVLGVTLLNVKGIMLRFDRMWIVGVFRTICARAEYPSGECCFGGRCGGVCG